MRGAVPSPYTGSSPVRKVASAEPRPATGRPVRADRTLGPGEDHLPRSLGLEVDRTEIAFGVGFSIALVAAPDVVPRLTATVSMPGTRAWASLVRARSPEAKMVRMPNWAATASPRRTRRRGGR